MKYKKYVSIGGNKPIWVITEDDKIINKNPTKEELRGLKIEPWKKYTKKQIIGNIQRFYEKKRRIPTENDFNISHEYPSSNTVCRYFGGWNNAIREAGLVPGIYIPDEELLEFLRQFYKEKGRIPGEKDFINNHKYPG